MKDKKIQNKRRLKGVVVSTKMDKTAVVKITRKKMHSKYKKQYKTTKNYKVHDEKSIAKIGDTIMFEECRPLSKDKRWRIVNIIK
jgi:small subunit ribosomal protein S17